MLKSSLATTVKASLSAKLHFWKTFYLLIRFFLVDFFPANMYPGSSRVNMSVCISPSLGERGDFFGSTASHVTNRTSVQHGANHDGKG